MKEKYTDERSVQIVIALLKVHGIRKIIASPGATNITFVASLRQDSYFEIYSSVDERSAAYMACGLASESNEPVVLSCTGATASRNYLPGLTEAFYRKLPVLAITSTQNVANIAHCMPQVIDRTSLPNDVAKLSVTLPIIKDDNDLWDCEIKVNRALLELKRHGGGPVHINMPTTYSRNYNVKELPIPRIIDRITMSSSFPMLPQGRIGVFIGSHVMMSKEETELLDNFCASNNAVVFCDHTSGYKGKYRLLSSLIGSQDKFSFDEILPDVLIHIGEVSGDYGGMALARGQIWRVNEDGEIRDTFRKLRYVFEMPETSFFKHYIKGDKQEDSYYKKCKQVSDAIYSKIPELPFSNIWIASRLADQIPAGSTIHFGILNSLRSWNFFELPNSVSSMSNVGGFGIDGCVSTLIGASLVNRSKLYFGVIGDLAFFYDMNSIGNRHIEKNLRLIIINNGKGVEFRNYNHPGAQFGEDADEYIAAAGHFGNKSKMLVRNYAQSLGFEYFSARDKQQFDVNYKRFISSQMTERPLLFEIFTDDFSESEALKVMRNIECNIKGQVKEVLKKELGEKGIRFIKKMINK